MLTSQAQAESHCHEKAKVRPRVRRQQGARGSLRGAKTTLALPLGRGVPASRLPRGGGGLSIAGGCYREIQ